MAAATAPAATATYTPERSRLEVVEEVPRPEEDEATPAYRAEMQSPWPPPGIVDRAELELDRVASRARELAALSVRLGRAALFDRHHRSERARRELAVAREELARALRSARQAAIALEELRRPE